MSNLSIRFDIKSDRLSAPVATDILRENGKRVWHGSTSLGSVTSVAVEPAETYLVRAYLPSGYEASAQAHAINDAAVVLRPRFLAPSPALEWAYYLKRRRRLESPVVFDAKNIALWSRRSSSDMPYDMGRDVRWTRASDEELAAAVTFERIPPQQSGESDDLIQLIFERAPRAGVQWWLQTGENFCAIPSGPRVRAVLAIDSSLGLPFIVGNDRGDADAMIGYLTGGDFASAREIGAVSMDSLRMIPAVDPLAGTSPNPSAAAIFGYYVVRAIGIELLDDVQHKSFASWLRQFTTKFASVPDGWVILGWYELRRANLQGACAAFISACRSGIPLYAMGMRLLLDGLEHCADKDARANDVQRWLKACVRFANWDTDTTVLALNAPFSALAIPFIERIQRDPDRSSLPVAASMPEEAGSGRGRAFSELRVTLPWHVEIGPAAVPEIVRRGTENAAFNPRLMQLVKRLEEHPLEFDIVQSTPGRRRAMLERLNIDFDVDLETRWVVIQSVSPIPDDPGPPVAGAGLSPGGPPGGPVALEQKGEHAGV